MCLVVDYSEKSVKSDYFGVIIYNWWRKVRKIGIFADQNTYFTRNLHEDPEYSGFFAIKIPNLGVVHAEYTKYSGYSMRFFRKIGKFAIIGVKLALKPNKLGRKLQKIGFFTKTSTYFHKYYFYK